jgi:hypothetical protein
MGRNRPQEFMPVTPYIVIPQRLHIGVIGNDLNHLMGVFDQFGIEALQLKEHERPEEYNRAGARRRGCTQGVEERIIDPVVSIPMPSARWVCCDDANLICLTRGAVNTPCHCLASLCYDSASSGAPRLAEKTPQAQRPARPTPRR